MKFGIVIMLVLSANFDVCDLWSCNRNKSCNNMTRMMQCVGNVEQDTWRQNNLFRKLNEALACCRRTDTARVTYLGVGSLSIVSVTFCSFTTFLHTYILNVSSLFLPPEQLNLENKVSDRNFLV
jgi:hypothetical protein